MKINDLKLKDHELNSGQKNIINNHPSVKKINGKDDIKHYNKFIVGGEIMHLDNLTAQQKEDVIQSKLLAQLHANHVASKEKTEDWYKAYTSVLESIGYVIDSFKFDRLTTSDSSLSVDKVLLMAMAEVASGNELGTLETLLKGIKKLESGSNKLTLFSSHSSDSTSGKFQISLGKANEIGNPELSMGAYYTSNDDSRGHFLFISWGELKIKIWASAERIELDTKMFSVIRDDIFNKVSPFLKKNVQAISI